MFIGDEVKLDVGFAAARAGLASLARAGALTSASEDAYGEGITELLRVGPLDSVPGVSKLVQVRLHDLVERENYAGVALRWEATGPGSSLFPALDADLTVTPAGQRSTVLKLAGSYRPPLGMLGSALDAAILHRVATATIRTFLARIAAAVANPPAGAAGPGHRPLPR